MQFQDFRNLWLRQKDSSGRINGERFIFVTAWPDSGICDWIREVHIYLRCQMWPLVTFDTSNIYGQNNALYSTSQPYSEYWVSVYIELPENLWNILIGTYTYGYGNIAKCSNSTFIDKLDTGLVEPLNWRWLRPGSILNRISETFKLCMPYMYTDIKGNLTMHGGIWVICSWTTRISKNIIQLSAVKGKCVCVFA